MTTYQSHSIDKFISSVLPEFKEFVDNVYRNPFKNKINRIYDTNKNDFTDIIELSERYIVKKYCIDIMKKNRISKRVYNHTHLGEVLGVVGTISHSDMILEDIDDFILKCLLKINGLKLNGKINFTIDNYCNIYIPNVKLYILNNHSKYNLYSFYVSLNTIFNLDKYLLIDMLELERNKIFQLFQIKYSKEYIKYNSDIHVFLNAIKYKDMVNSLKPYIELSNKFKSQYNEITKESNEIVDDSEITKESNEIVDDSEITKKSNEINKKFDKSKNDEDIEITTELIYDSCW